MDNQTQEPGNRPAPKLSRLSRAALWLYVQPHKWLLDKLDRIDGWIHTRMPIQVAHLLSAAVAFSHPLRGLSDKLFNSYSRQVELIEDADLYEPYDPASDAPVISKALIIVGATVGALVLLCSVSALITPNAVQFALHFSEWARACAAGWIK